jgi:hypothetical protein
MPVTIESIFKVFGFKMTEFWVNSYEIIRKLVEKLVSGSINRYY